jgi:hypothetical protein
MIFGGGYYSANLSNKYWRITVKRNFILAVAALLIALPFTGAYGGKSAGLASGNLTTADACGFGAGYIGGFVGFGDEVTSLFGTLTYGFSDYTEGRVRFGFSDLDVPDTDPQLLIGFDFKYEFLDYYDTMRNNPLDLAFGGFIEFVNYDPVSVLELGGNLLASIPYKLKSGQRLIPYSRFDMRLERVSNGGSESDFRAGLNLGAKFELTQDVHLYGEFQLDGNAGFFAGLEVRAF